MIGNNMTPFNSNKNHIHLAFLSLLLTLCVHTSTLAQLASLEVYQELPDPHSRNLATWSNVTSGAHSGFVSTNQHFDRSSAPSQHDVQSQWSKTAWRGERVHTQGIIYTTRRLNDIQLIVSDLQKDQHAHISKEHVKANFVRYVMADDPKGLKQGCAISVKLDTALHADMIDPISSLSMEDSTSRPLWLSVDVPRHTPPGIYSGTLTIKAENYSRQHPFTITVLAHTLPEVQDWTFQLDLWQNPYSDARVYGVPLWSNEHFQAMRASYQMLRDAGQKVITTTLIHDPWSSQTYDVYGGMIKWIKQKDGSWTYDYRIFDKWVQFMMDIGIDQQISAYSMIPWTLKFQYYDEVSGQDQMFEAKPDSQAYATYWGSMLRDFARHLKSKGWFDITTIAMDERPEKDMQAAIKVIRDADSAFRISMAGNYHEELQADLVDYSVASTQTISSEVLQSRKEKGYITKFYTSCTEIFPNTYTSSDYAELNWMAWHALHKHYDGYLRWDYNNWNRDPFKDSRFGPFPAGDTYFVYPGARSSIRFERLREGIQDFEKVTFLRRQFKANGHLEDLKKLEDVIQAFTIQSLNGKNAHIALEKAQAILNSL
ncbi:DUF4091 domain-containing protein [Sphingobacterium sp. SYP-B4668]|uniref:DUF4091 domain-containing protein n=1 Tax=Sphingobacterium sp. SYP-B4668 TaxID=2996035 RepID=UPI0022DD7CDC|nr:glycoside hydrolase domain-containing protein [Sphingobacterium sp. SYP-B4668]